MGAANPEFGSVANAERTEHAIALCARHGDPRVPRHLAEIVQRSDPTRAAGIGDERGSPPLRRGRGAPAGCR